MVNTKTILGQLFAAIYKISNGFLVILPKVKRYLSVNKFGLCVYVPKIVTLLKPILFF